MAMLTQFSAFAQPEEREASFLETATEQELLLMFVLALVVVVSLLVLGVAYYTLTILKLVINEKRQEKAAAEGVEYKPAPSFWSRFNQTVTDAVPIEKEGEVMLDHNYDGIRELDNHLPPWWKWLFYFTIGWGAVYLVVYHVIGTMPLQTEEYQQEVAAAQAAIEAQKKLAGGGADITEDNVAFVDAESALANGQKLFERNCAVCHQNDGGGGVGPNLTDNYWLHGGSISDIFSTIKYGVPEKGMISWQAQLSPADMQDVSSYILTLVGTTPANPKEPQGELYTPEEPAEEAAPQDSTSVDESTSIAANLN